MEDDDILFCENKYCRVVTYKPITATGIEETRSNCPGCGQFGRTKDK